MALLKCPECEHNVADKAVACPHCGYPMNSPTSTKPRIRNGKPTKLPNGCRALGQFNDSIAFAVQKAVLTSLENLKIGDMASQLSFQRVMAFGY